MIRPGPVACILASLLFLGACAETELAIHAAKRLGPKPTPKYKIGAPYAIDGVYYYPSENYRYRESGIASWYGAKFHGRATANGEIYNMNDLTAAHRTLPLPSIVRVVNLDNGRAINLRVNDRGPFARGRIIDVSRRAAQLLGFQRKGTTRVQVRILPEESRRVAALASRGQIAETRNDQVNGQRRRLKRGNAPSQGVVIRPAIHRRDAPRNGVALPVQDALFIQAGAFTQYANAQRARLDLGRFMRATVLRTEIGPEHFYRVRLGPIRGADEADRLLARVFASGYPKARIVAD